jgi:glutamyl-tRNA synthetase
VPSLWAWLGEDILEQIPEPQRLLFAETIKANIEFPQDAIVWSKVFFDESLPMDTEQVRILHDAGKEFFIEAERGVEKYGINLVPILKDMKQTLGLSGKKLFMPLRVALTGKTDGPELAQIAALLGPEKVQQRLRRAYKLANKKTERSASN